MTFQIKDFRSIVASMINVTRASNSKITDFSVGSVARTLMEAPAIEIEELYLQMLLGLQEAIPTAIFTSFSFARSPSLPASGTVRFSCAPSDSAILISAGTKVKSETSAFEYATSVDAIIAAGSTYVDALVSCAIAGAAGNCASGALTVMVAPVSGITALTNALALSNGADEESDAARKMRFQAYITTLSRGTNAALRYGASLSSVTDSLGNVIERAEHVAIFEPYLLDSSRPIGLVNIYIHNGLGETSANLVDRVARDINGYYQDDGTPVPGWKSAGVKVEVFIAEEVPVSVSGVITMSANVAKPTALANEMVGDYIRSLGIGAPVIQSEIISIIMTLPGVYNVTLSSPATDVVVTSTQKPMPLVIALT